MITIFTEEFQVTLVNAILQDFLLSKRVYILGNLRNCTLWKSHKIGTEISLKFLFLNVPHYSVCH